MAIQALTRLLIAICHDLVRDVVTSVLREHKLLETTYRRVDAVSLFQMHESPKIGPACDGVARRTRPVQVIVAMAVLASAAVWSFPYSLAAQPAPTMVACPAHTDAWAGRIMLLHRLGHDVECPHCAVIVF